MVYSENACSAFDEDFQNNVFVWKELLHCLESIGCPRQVDDLALAVVHCHISVERLRVHFKKPTVFSEACVLRPSLFMILLPFLCCSIFKGSSTHYDSLLNYLSRYDQHILQLSYNVH